MDLLLLLLSEEVMFVLRFRLGRGEGSREKKTGSEQKEQHVQRPWDSRELANFKEFKESSVDGEQRGVGK